MANDSDNAYLKAEPAVHDGRMRTQLKSHPLADLLPAMSDAEYVELRESIRVNGLREPIMLHRDGRIIDGRHRARACAELRMAMRTRAFAGKDSEILDYVMDLNVERRHLDETQRAMIADKLATMSVGRPGKIASIQAITQAQAAAKLKVSRTAVQQARALPQQSQQRPFSRIAPQLSPPSQYCVQYASVRFRRDGPSTPFCKQTDYVGGGIPMKNIMDSMPSTPLILRLR